MVFSWRDRLVWKWTLYGRFYICVNVNMRLALVRGVAEFSEDNLRLFGNVQAAAWEEWL